MDMMVEPQEVLPAQTVAVTDIPNNDSLRADIEVADAEKPSDTVVEQEVTKQEEATTVPADV